METLVTLSSTTTSLVHHYGLPYKDGIIVEYIFDLTYLEDGFKWVEGANFQRRSDNDVSQMMKQDFQTAESSNYAIFI